MQATAPTPTRTAAISAGLVAGVAALGVGDTVTIGGQAMVIVGDIQTANATVFLVDTVMIPPSVSGG